MSAVNELPGGEDELLAYLWEWHERGEALERDVLIAAGCEKFTLAADAVEKIVDEFLLLADFSGACVTNASIDAEVIKLDSFLHYEIGELNQYRRGGLASVHRAFDTRFERPVAVKVPLRRFTNEKEVCARIMREARLSARLQHPNIVPIYDFGDQGPEGCPFFVMKYVDGITLLEAIHTSSRDAASTLRLLRVVRDVVGALEHAHSRGIIHRDIKPENVMIGAHHETHLLDLGCAEETANLEQQVSARSRAIERFSQTVHGGVFGTYAYMSPEQAKGHLHLQSPKSDVFGVGGLLCHVLTGDPVYCGDTESIVAQAKSCQTEPARERLLSSRAHKQLLDLTLSCLYPEPQRRPTAAEVGEALDRYFDSIAQESVRNERRAKIAVAALAALSLVAMMSLVLGGLYRQYLTDGRTEEQVWTATEKWTLERLDEVNEEREQLAEQLHQISLDSTFEPTPALDKLQHKVDQILELTQPLKAYPEVAERSQWILEQLAIDRERAFSERERQESSALRRETIRRTLQAMRETYFADEQAALNAMLGAVTPVSRQPILERREKILLGCGINLRGEQASDWGKQLDAFTAEQRAELAIHVESMLHDATFAPEQAVVENLLSLAKTLDASPLRSEWRRLTMLPGGERAAAFKASCMRATSTLPLPVRLMAARVAADLGIWSTVTAMLGTVASEVTTASDAELTASASILLACAEESGTARESRELLEYLVGRQYDVAAPMAIACALVDDWAGAERWLAATAQGQSLPAYAASLTAWVHACLGHESQAIGALGRLANASGHGDDLLNCVAEILSLLHLGRYEQAQVRLEAYRAHVAQTEIVKLLDAELAAWTGHESQAEALASELIGERARWSAPRVLHARVLSTTGRDAEALIAIEEAMDRGMASRQLLQVATTSAARHGNWFAARDYALSSRLLGFTSKATDEAALRVMVADAPVKLGERVCQMQSALQPSSVDAAIAWGDVLIRRGEVEQAATAYQAALALSPQSSRAAEGLIRSLVLGNRAAEAGNQLRPLLGADSQTVTLSRDRSRLRATASLLMGSDLEDAELMFEHLQRFPDDAEARLALAEFLQRCGHTNDARRQLLLALADRGQSDAVVELRLATMLDAQGLKDEKRQLLNKLFRSGKRSVAAVELLGQPFEAGFESD